MDISALKNYCHDLANNCRVLPSHRGSHTFELSCSGMSDSATLCAAAHQGPLSMVSPDKNTGMGCYFILQEDLINIQQIIQVSQEIYR